MTINKPKRFTSGIVLLIIPFMAFKAGFSNRLEPENLDVIVGTVKDVEKIYPRRSKAQNGWVIQLNEYDFSLRISGARYSALDSERFDDLIMPGVEIRAGILKHEVYNLSDHVNNLFSIKDIFTLGSKNLSVLRIADYKDESKHQNMVNTILGVLATCFAAFQIITSINKTTNKA